MSIRLCWFHLHVESVNAVLSCSAYTCYVVLRASRMLTDTRITWCHKKGRSGVFAHAYSIVCCPAVPVPCQDKPAVCLHTDCPSFMTAALGLMQKVRRRNCGLVDCVPWRRRRQIPAKYWCHIPVTVHIDSGVKPLPAELPCHCTFLYMA